MSKYEKAKLIGVRAEQLARGAPLNLTEVERDGLIDVIDLAERELQLGKLPLTINREFPQADGHKIIVVIPSSHLIDVTSNP